MAQAATDQQSRTAAVESRGSANSGTAREVRASFRRITGGKYDGWHEGPGTRATHPSSPPPLTLHLAWCHHRSSILQLACRSQTTSSLQAMTPWSSMLTFELQQARSLLHLRMHASSARTAHGLSDPPLEVRCRFGVTVRVRAQGRVRLRLSLRVRVRVRVRGLGWGLRLRLGLGAMMGGSTHPHQEIIQCLRCIREISSAH